MKKYKINIEGKERVIKFATIYDHKKTYSFVK